MTHASPAPRKVPKWLVTPGVFVLFLVFLGNVPSVSAAYEDAPPATQEVAAGWSNGTFPDNITLSDDTYIEHEWVNSSSTTIYYNWTALNATGDRWQIIIECRAASASVALISVLTPPSTFNVRLVCPTFSGPYDVDVQASCTDGVFCGPYSDWNLTVEEFNNGTPSMLVQSFGSAQPLLFDQIIVRRVYTVAGPGPSPSPLLDWMLILLLLILWVSFCAIGAAKTSGLLFMGGSLCGVILAFFFVLPAAELPGIAVLGLAMTCMLGGVGIAISSGGEAG